LNSARGSNKNCCDGISCRDVLDKSRWLVLLKGLPPIILFTVLGQGPDKFLAMFAAGKGQVQSVVVLCVLQLSALPVILALPLAEAIGVRVGEHLGMSQVQQAKKTCMVGLLSGFSSLVMVGVAMVAVMPWLARAFTNNPLVVASLLEIRWCFALISVNMTSMLCMAVLTKQNRSYFVLGSVILQYVVQVPAFFAQSWTGIADTLALIWAQAIAQTAGVLWLYWCVWRSDWKAISENCISLCAISNQGKATTQDADSPKSSEGSSYVSNVMETDWDNREESRSALPVLLSSTKAWEKSCSKDGGSQSPVPEISQARVQTESNIVDSDLLDSHVSI